jgi:hypothetical protein
VNCSDGEVVLECERVESTKQGSELSAARRLAIDDVYIAAIVDVEED